MLRLKGNYSPKVLLLCLSFLPSVGGIQRFLSGLCSEYPCPENLVVLAPLLPNCAEYDLMQPFKVYRYPSALVQNQGHVTKTVMVVDAIRILLNALRIVRQEKIKVICAGEASLALLVPAFILHWLLRIRWYTFAYGTDFLHVQSRWQRWIFTRVIKSITSVMTDFAIYW